MREETIPPNVYNEKDRVKLCLAGIGSPHGNDAAGWRVAEGLRSRLPCVHVYTLAEPTALLPLLGQYERMWIVDACRSGKPVGTVTRLAWPDERIDRHWSVSGHGIGLAEVLELATTLGHDSTDVTLYAIDIGRTASRPDDPPSGEVYAACNELRERLRVEIDAFERGGPNLLTTAEFVENGGANS